MFDWILNMPLTSDQGKLQIFDAAEAKEKDAYIFVLDNNKLYVYVR